MLIVNEMTGALETHKYVIQVTTHEKWTPETVRDRWNEGIDRSRVTAQSGPLRGTAELALAVPWRSLCRRHPDWPLIMGRSNISWQGGYLMTPEREDWATRPCCPGRWSYFMGTGPAFGGNFTRDFYLIIWDGRHELSEWRIDLLLGKFGGCLEKA